MSILFEAVSVLQTPPLTNYTRCPSIRVISHDSTKFVLPRVFILIESAKSPFPVDVHRSKTSP